MRHKINQILVAALAIAISFALMANNAMAKVYEHKIPLTEFDNPPEGEMDNINKIAKAQGKLQTLRYSGVNVKKLRNVHPKAHGCVNASFTVNKDIKKELQVGLFSKPGQTFENVKIRFSNATIEVNSDLSPQKRARSRGMAIQIPDVERILGQKVIDVPRQKGTQDFLMINQPVFLISNVEKYLEITNYQIEQLENAEKIKKMPPQEQAKWDPAGRFVSQPNRFGEAVIATSIVKTPLSDPLESNYFSAAPFLLGKDKVMKYRVAPCKKSPEQNNPQNPSDDFLRQAMKKHLTEKEACFDFLIQVPTISDRDISKDLGLEDATFEWIHRDSQIYSLAGIKIGLAQKFKIPDAIIPGLPPKGKKGIPYIKVAQITIPKQNFDTRVNDETCENLELSPWHSLTEHQPVGGINRLRNPIYSESAKGRKNQAGQKNQMSQKNQVTHKRLR